MKIFAAALALVSFAVADEMDTKFMEYIAGYGKSYGTIEEYNFRKA